MSTPHLLFFSLFFLAQQSLAEEHPATSLVRDVDWSYLSTGCIDLKLPGKQALSKDGPSWDLGVEATLKKIEVFTQNTCPKFLENPNSPELLKKFVAENQEVNGGAIELSKQGEVFSQSLQKDGVLLDRYMREVGIRGDETPCGIYYAERKNHVLQKVQQLTLSVEKIKKSCSAFVERNIASSLPKPLTPKGNGGPGLPAPNSKNGGALNSKSDITGTKKALEDAARGAPR